jgi:hypothetical protein
VPAVGDSLDLLLVKLAHAEGEPADVELRELRPVDVGREPWRSLDLAAARENPALLAVIAARSCAFREGLARRETLRGSWYLLREGRLAAFDHAGFGPACTARPAFEPAAPDDAPTERSLQRWVSQRFPLAGIPAEERLARGLRLLERGRREEAARELFALDQRLDELARRQNEFETPDADERARLAREEEQLRPLRAQLHHALAERDAKEEETP